MRKAYLMFYFVVGFVLGWSVLCSADFYVIPVKSAGECSGDATVGDVLVGKTFSNSTATGLTGTRPHAPVEKTGQASCWDTSGGPTPCTGTGQDGEYQKGIPWPSPRFTDNLDGTVTDNMTGLIWLKYANCFGLRDWTTALTDCTGLTAGWCGLTDGSSTGDWRLPNVRELQSLIDFGKYAPALPSGHPFTGVQSGHYWSSTTIGIGPLNAWGLDLCWGDANVVFKLDDHYVWPVRAGQ